MGVTRLEAAEKSDAGRVAPISACVFYQIDRLKSGFEAMGRTVMPGNCAPIRGSVWCLSMFCVFAFYRTTIIVKL